MAVAARLAERAATYRDVVMAGRSHNVAAQATTLGKRFASAAQETLIALTRIRELLDRYPLRGIKGPMGTAQDMLDLLDGDTGRLAELERRIAEFLGFSAVLTSVGQVYPARWTTTWSRPWCSWARAVVLRAHGPVDGRARVGHRGFRAGTGRFVGDAAQDEHPQLRTGQRPAGGAARLRRDGRRTGWAQWNEGDVFCSVVRRVALPDAFFAVDGQIETFLTVLEEFGAYPR